MEKRFVADYNNGRIYEFESCLDDTNDMVIVNLRNGYVPMHFRLIAIEQNVNEEDEYNDDYYWRNPTIEEVNELSFDGCFNIYEKTFIDMLEHNDLELIDKLPEIK